MRPKQAPLPRDGVAVGSLEQAVATPLATR